MRVLLIEDDAIMGNNICTGLKRYNYTVDWLKNGENISVYIKNEVFDVLIIDLEISNKSGLALLKEFRSKNYNVPIFVLAEIDMIEERIAAFNNGADDCVTKPPNIPELSARLRAVQRRSMTGHAQPQLIYRDLVLDPNNLRVTLLGKPIPMSRREFALLKKLLENVGRVVSRETLTQSLYGWHDDIDSNTLEVHTHNLRKKLTMPFIKTIRGIGYLIEAERGN